MREQSAFDVFVSYATEDREYVEDLITALKKRSVTVWYDKDQMQAGHRIHQEIENAINKSLVCIAVLSDSYFSKNWTEDELSALTRKRHNGYSVVPVWHKASQELMNSKPMLAGLSAFFSDKTSASDIALEVAKLVGGTSVTCRADTGGAVPGNSAPIPVILVGFGQWARESTVVPLQQTRPDLFDPVYVTELKDGAAEHANVVVAEFTKVNLTPPDYARTLKGAIDAIKKSAKYKGLPIAVVINTPNKMHFAAAETALGMGCHVYAERPADHTADDYKKLVEEAEGRKLLFYTGVQRRVEAPYKYLFQTIQNHRYFGQLASIRCLLGSGHPLEGWRADPNFTGGGIVLDEGYHLLDAATWLLEAHHGGTKLEKKPIEVAVHFEDHSTGGKNARSKTIRIERRAVGMVKVRVNSGKVCLFFDLEKYYQVPKPGRGSVFELLEIRDTEGNVVRLVRDKRRVPGRIYHEYKGSPVVNNEFVEMQEDRAVPLVGEHKEGDPPKADISAPLRQFLSNIRCFEPANADGRPNFRPMKNECDARFVVNTQEVIQAIYRVIDVERGKPEADRRVVGNSF